MWVEIQFSNYYFILRLDGNQTIHHLLTAIPIFCNYYHWFSFSLNCNKCELCKLKFNSQIITFFSFRVKCNDYSFGEWETNASNYYHSFSFSPDSTECKLCKLKFNFPTITFFWSRWKSIDYLSGEWNTNFFNYYRSFSFSTNSNKCELCKLKFDFPTIPCFSSRWKSIDYLSGEWITNSSILIVPFHLARIQTNVNYVS